MSFLDLIRSLLKNTIILYALLTLTALLGGWFFFFRGGAPAETLVVRRGDFIEQVSVSGTVVAAQNVDLGFSGGGRVSRVYARVGGAISQGVVIAEVENSDLRANLLQKQAALEVQEAKLAALASGTRPEEIAVVEAAVENDRLTLNQANQGVVNAIQDAYAKSDDAIHNKVDQFIGNPRSTNPQLTFEVSDVQLKASLISGRISIEQILKDWQNQNAGLSAYGDINAAGAAAKSELAAVSMLLANASAVLNRAISNASVSQSTISGYIADVATARTNVNSATTALNTAQTTRASATATLAKDEKTLALDRAGSTPEDIAAEVAQVKSAKADIESARAQLAKTIVVAPFSGTITKMDAKVGAIVSANTSQISMISNGTYRIESFVPEINIARLHVGDPATTTLDAYGASVPFGARVVSIDPAETVRDGVSTYKTVLEFLSSDPRIRSGMTANVVITTVRKEDVIGIPQSVIVEKSGKKFVPVQNDDATTEVEVTTGSISSLGNIEILSGLNEGDIVVLSN